MLVWAHPNPDDMEGKLDRLFFQNVMIYMSDAFEGKEKMSLSHVMLMQHVTETALIMFPKLWLLGPLRWWIPLQLQALGSAIARWSGKKPLMEKYSSKEEWESIQDRIGGKPKRA
ncbi:hypothetical protein PV10_03274 [Exophiala mesophila]|uniref:Uncharacterized protein n=1 Tax=Exophiala mesophila TaxID=212818 RepID=A0A0D2A9K6_EXOME|nr:uncharacterized protein PV10_03274 [Exophiala mesophila]KIV95648.1 hypothetical protein PV10_03274 [Exophiala mesophila]